MSPGDGTGGHHIEDTLICTMLAIDIEELRKEAILVAEKFTNASTLRMTSEEGTDFEIDISGLEGISSDEYLWNKDKNEFTGTWSALPPAAPGIIIPKGRGNGVLAVDGFLLYEPAYDHEKPTSPVFLTFEEGKIVNVEGEQQISTCRKQWSGQAGRTAA